MQGLLHGITDAAAHSNWPTAGPELKTRSMMEVHGSYHARAASLGS